MEEKAGRLGADLFSSVFTVTGTAGDDVTGFGAPNENNAGVGEAGAGADPSEDFSRGALVAETD